MTTEWYQGPAHSPHWWALFLVVVVLGVLALMTLFLYAATHAYDVPAAGTATEDDRTDAAPPADLHLEPAATAETPPAEETRLAS